MSRSAINGLPLEYLCNTYIFWKVLMFLEPNRIIRDPLASEKFSKWTIACQVRHFLCLWFVRWSVPCLWFDECDRMTGEENRCATGNRWLVSNDDVRQVYHTLLNSLSVPLRAVLLCIMPQVQEDVIGTHIMKQSSMYMLPSMALKAQLRCIMPQVQQDIVRAQIW